MIRLIIAALLIGCGLFVLAVATLGIFRLDYVLNRVHMAAKCDTLGGILFLLGLIVWAGPSAATPKLLLILVFLWTANPVASHLIARTEILLAGESAGKDSSDNNPNNNLNYEVIEDDPV